MEKTGVYFEMTETFTLENMFAMELDKHADVLNEIVTAAIKEIAIEKVGLLPGRPRRGGRSRHHTARAHGSARRACISGSCWRQS